MQTEPELWKSRLRDWKKLETLQEQCEAPQLSAYTEMSAVWRLRIVEGFGG